MQPLFADTPGDLVSRQVLVGLSGLDFLRGIRDGRYPAPPIAKLLDYRLHEVEAGRVVFRGTPRFEFCNPLGSVHGGWYGTLLDSAMACAVHSTLPAGAAYTTLEYKVNITRPIPLGMEVDAVAQIQHGGRRTGIASAEIRGVEDGRLYATGSTTCIMLPLDP